MPTTPIYNLRYPLPTDPADVPVDLQELALDVEGKLGGPPVTTLPGAPVDGQIARVKVSANGPIWTFQYLAASAAPNRWHFVGGGDLAVDQVSTFSTASAGPVAVAPAHALPSIPWAGDYRVYWGGVVTSSAADGITTLGIAVGAVAPGAYESVASLLTRTSALGFAVAGESTRVLPANAVLSVWQWATGGTSSSFFRSLRARPIRVAG